ncbi:MAG: ATP-grasp domain-containing protein [Alphaproteobacteria bacterium]|nr:ATP-grasp domain-containing protein [Alphaproteobacteria bacterium]
MNRRQALEAIRQAIGRKKLLWFGVRSTDAVSLTTYGLESVSFLSLISPLSLAGLDEYCLEHHTKRRVDLDDYLLDLDPSPEGRGLLDRISACGGQEFLLVPYGASKPVESEVQQAGGDFLGIGAALARQLNNKFEVQQALAGRGLSVLPSLRFRDQEDEAFHSFIKAYVSFVVRGDYSGGGRNLWRVTSPEAFSELLTQKPDLFTTCSFSPYMGEALSLNMEACLARGGSCFVGPTRLQLIGCPQATCRPFGYCGNDFSISSFLGKADLLLCHTMMEQIGAWLSAQGYVGAFGVDALYQDGELFFVELNPRLQGSTALSVQMAQDDNRIDILMAHLLAWLGIPFSARPEVYLEEALAQKQRAQIYLHNLSDVATVSSGVLDAGAGWDMIPDAGVVLDPVAVRGRLVTNGPVTHNGKDLLPSVVSQLGSL